MRSILLVYFSVAISFQSVLAASPFGTPAVNIETDIVPNAYIVELDGAADAAALRKRGIFSSDIAHRAFYSQMKAKKLRYRITNEFNSAPEVFSGASVVLQGNTSSDALLAMDGVKVRS